MVSVIKSMYEGATTAVKFTSGESAEFEVKVGVHQGSVLSPLLFTIVLEALSKEFREGLPWELLYADDLALMAESKAELLVKIERWKEGIEKKGLRVNIGKTKVMKCQCSLVQALDTGKWPCGVCRKGGENAARAAKLGLWADSHYDVLDAETPTDVLARQGRFALVEGKVVSVRESGATIYVNFGRRWSEDFTVTVLKRNERNFTAAGLDLKGLAGRRIRVRGFIEARGGTGRSPWIEADYPEQIETADAR